MTPTRQQRRMQGARGTITARTVNTGQAPCRTLPEEWDAPPNDDRQHGPRVRGAVKTCRTECPVLAECLAYLATWEHPDGVIAGQVWRDGARLS